MNKTESLGFKRRWRRGGKGRKTMIVLQVRGEQLQDVEYSEPKLTE